MGSNPTWGNSFFHFFHLPQVSVFLSFFPSQVIMYILRFSVWCLWWFNYPGLHLYTKFQVVPSAEYCGFKSHLRQFIFFHFFIFVSLSFFLSISTHHVWYVRSNSFVSACRAIPIIAFPRVRTIYNYTCIYILTWVCIVYIVKEVVLFRGARSINGHGE